MTTFNKGDFIYIDDKNLPSKFKELFSSSFWEHNLKAIVIKDDSDGNITVTKQIEKPNEYSYSTQTNIGMVFIDTQKFISIPAKFAKKCDDEHFLSSSCAIYKIILLHNSTKEFTNEINKSKKQKPIKQFSKKNKRKISTKKEAEIRQKRKYSGLNSLLPVDKKPQNVYRLNYKSFQGGRCSGK